MAPLSGHRNEISSDVVNANIPWIGWPPFRATEERVVFSVFVSD